jgi:hypothetical protein
VVVILKAFVGTLREFGIAGGVIQGLQYRILEVLGRIDGGARSRLRVVLMNYQCCFGGGDQMPTMAPLLGKVNTFLGVMKG